jgi:hypothetical protein
MKNLMKVLREVLLDDEVKAELKANAIKIDNLEIALENAHNSIEQNFSISSDLKKALSHKDKEHKEEVERLMLQIERRDEAAKRVDKKMGSLRKTIKGVSACFFFSIIYNAYLIILLLLS